MMRTKHGWYRRGFLNPGSSDETGWYLFNIARTKGYKDRRTLEVTFTLADCSRSISLDFGLWSGESTKTRRAKVKKFRNVINEFCNEMEEALDWVDQGREEQT